MLAKSISKDFIDTSLLLYNAIGGADELKQTEINFHNRVDERFRELVEEKISLAETVRSDLLTITELNRQAVGTKISGQMELLIDQAASVQLDLLLEWLRHDTPPESLKNDSLTIWNQIQYILQSSSDRIGK